MAELSNEGSDTAATTSAASTRPRARPSGTATAGAGDSNAATISACSSTVRIRVLDTECIVPHRRPQDSVAAPCTRPTRVLKPELALDTVECQLSSG